MQEWDAPKTEIIVKIRNTIFGAGLWVVAAGASALSLGAWITFAGTLGRNEARDLVARAFDAGINLFDSAENYAHGAAEALLGDVLADLRLPRDAFCVTSKAFFGPVSAPRPTQPTMQLAQISLGRALPPVVGAELAQPGGGRSGRAVRARALRRLNDRV